MHCFSLVVSFVCPVLLVLPGRKCRADRAVPTELLLQNCHCSQKALSHFIRCFVLYSYIYIYVCVCAVAETMCDAVTPALSGVGQDPSSTDPTRLSVSLHEGDLMDVTARGTLGVSQ